MLITGWGICMWGDGGYVEIPVPSFQFCYEPKTALKIAFKYREKIIMIGTL